MPDQSDTSAAQDSLSQVSPTPDVASAEELPSKSNVASAPARRRMSAALGDAIKNLMPDRVIKLEDKYGPAIFVGFCLGLVAGVIFAVGALMKSDWLRAALLPPSATSSPTPQPGTVEKEKLLEIEFSPDSEAPVFLADYVRLLSGYGVAGKPTGMTDDPPLGIVVREFPKPTLGFGFSVQPRLNNWRINARLFRQTKVEGRVTYEPILPHESLPGVIKFKVGDCNAGERLLMVVLVIPQSAQTLSGGAIKDYFSTQLQ